MVSGASSPPEDFSLHVSSHINRLSLIKGKKKIVALMILEVLLFPIKPHLSKTPRPGVGLLKGSGTSRWPVRSVFAQTPGGHFLLLSSHSLSSRWDTTDPVFNKHLGFAGVTWGLVDAGGSVGGCLLITMVTMAKLEPKMAALGEGASPDGVIMRGEEAEDGGRSSELSPGSGKKPRELEHAHIS